MPKKPERTLHMIGHGHIDPTWLWRWVEGYEEVRATFRSALDRLRETPDLFFTASSACFYAWVEQCEPAMFKEIQARVKEGRWEIVGGFWIEPDCNLPCGEAFVRQGLYGQRYFARAFGKQSVVGFNPDSFGHASALPQILTGLGLKYYAFQRPQAGEEKDFPEGTTFWWESPDGARVLTCNLLESYNADQELEDRMTRLPHSPHLNRGQKDILCFFGVGNHGGGPTKQAIEDIASMQEADPENYPAFSTLENYFTSFLASTKPENIAVLRDELQHHARGCYSVHSEIKRLNRKVEHALMRAERVASVATMLDLLPYPKESLNEAWKHLLYNQFHDILAGTSIESSYDDARDQLGAAHATAQSTLNLATQTIASKIDTTPEGNTIVVFNTLTWPVRQVVLVSPIIRRTLDLPLHIADGDGNAVPVQEAPGEYVASKRYAFVAEVPALGYNTYHARSGARNAQSSGTLAATQHTLENDWWAVRLDPNDGAIAGLRDKQTGVDYLKKGALLDCMADSSDTWSHGIAAYRSGVGHFENARITLVDEGAVFATIRATTTFRDSTAITEYTMYRDTPVIDLTVRVNWQESYTALKFCFDTNITDAVATYETAYGHDVRPTNGEEQPGQQWASLCGHVNDQSCGLAVIGDGQYGYDAKGGMLRVTQLRSPAYAHHDPDVFSPKDGPAIMDQGWHTARFRIVPHSGDWQTAGIVRQAWEHNVPLYPHPESAHPGTLGASSDFLGTNSDQVLFTVVKLAEDGGDFVVRGYETHGRPAEVDVRLPSFDAVTTLRFNPYEIKTVRFDLKSKTFAACDLLEQT